MPSATFLVHVTVPDVSPLALAGEASEISEDLTARGHDVLSVAPWQRPATPLIDPAAGAAFAPPPVA